MKVNTNVFGEANSMLKSQLVARQKLLENLKYLKIHTSILQQEILTLKSQLDVKERQLKKSEDVKVFTNLQEECAGLKLQLLSQVKYLEEFKVHANKLKEENSKLVTRLTARHKISKDVEDMKVRTNILQEENSELKSQLELTQDQLRVSETEKKHYINKYSALKDKERCDIAIQTDMVCIRSVSS